MLTIIIPFHNRGSYLKSTLDSVAASLFRPVRLLLVDNGSTDKSRTVAEQFIREHASDDFQITLADEPRRGATAARNKGLSLCHTPFVYFFDSDDRFDPDFLSTVVPLLADDIDLLALTTSILSDGKERVRSFRPVSSVVAQILISHLATQSMVFRTDFLRSIGGWKESLTIWNDWELGVRALLAKPRLRWFTARPFHRILIHPDSLTGSGYSSRLPYIHDAMECVATELTTISDSARFALFLRMEIITGRLLAEKNTMGAEENKKMTRRLFTDESAYHHLIGAALRRMTAWGIPGAWRVAYALCK